MEQYYKVHLFWHEVERPINSSIKLCKLRELCIYSFLNMGYEVNFWSYQKIENKITNDNFILQDARLLVSEKAFNKLHIVLKKPIMGEKRNVLHIANFADWLRALIIYKHGGWWVDTDTYCLNKLPLPDEKDKGVIFTGIPTKVDGTRGIKFGLCSETKKIRKNESVWKNWDGREQYSNGIMFGEKNHHLMKKIANAVKNSFTEPFTYGFVNPMFVTLDVIKKYGYMASIRPHMYFVPLCWWRSKLYYIENDDLPDRQRTSYGAYIPTWKFIIKKSYTVNFYNGTFNYLFDKKDNVAKKILNHLLTTNKMKINIKDIKADSEINNFHCHEEKILLPERKRKKITPQER